jgi:flagellin-like hook-associated protein FlgL
VQTAEGALTETHSILQRMRDLSVQASNSGGLNDDAKGNIQSEVVQLKAELDRIANTTTFNGKKLLDGSYSANFQVGANAGETIGVNIATAMSAAGLNVAGVDVTGSGKYTNQAAAASGAVVTTTATSGANATLAISSSSAAVFAGGTTHADAYKSLEGTISFGGKSLDLSSVDYSNVDGDNNAATVGTDTQHLAALNKAAASAFGLASTATPFSHAGGVLTFTAPINTSGYTDAAGSIDGTAASIAKATPVFTASSGATSAITALDTAIKTVSTTRADLGAIQNRFDHTINNLNVAVENLTASESRIRDADMAQEMVQFTRNQILSQAGTSMLAQANQASQGVLSLLR